MYPFQWAKETTIECFRRGLKEVLNRSTHLANWQDNNETFLESYGLKVDAGATKVCIMADYMDWVIKIGFTRRYEKDPEHIDFCEIEHKNFIAARKEGVDRFLAPMYLVGAYEGIKIYIQQKEETNNEMIRDSLKGYYESAYCTEYYSDYCDMDEEETILAVLGPGKGVNDFIDFVLNHEINDLHNLNWGVNSAGQAVLIDYSGYF